MSLKLTNIIISIISCFHCVLFQNKCKVIFTNFTGNIFKFLVDWSLWFVWNTCCIMLRRHVHVTTAAYIAEVAYCMLMNQNCPLDRQKGVSVKQGNRRNQIEWACFLLNAILCGRLCANSKPHSRLTCESVSYCQYKNNTQLHYSLSKIIFLSLSWIPTFFLRYVLTLYDHKVQFYLSILQRTQTVRATWDGILAWRFQLRFSNIFSQKKKKTVTRF